jgi:hypothetical protein
MIYDDTLVNQKTRAELDAVQKQIENGALKVTDPGMQ